MKTIQATLLRQLSIQATLGEGAFWHAQQQAFWWSDIQSACLYRYYPFTDQLQQFCMPYRVACFAFIEHQNDLLLIAFEHKVAIYQLSTGHYHWLNASPPLPKNCRFNDGRVDHQGRFWVGSMDESDPAKPLGALYCIDEMGLFHEVLTEIKISNGLCFTTDNRYFYHSDSPSHQINRYQLTQQTIGTSEKKTIITFDQHSFPDGATLDADGYLWYAIWGKGEVVRLSPTGHIDFCINLPTPHVACVTFGGNNNELLFITTASHGLTPIQQQQYPQSGNVFIYQISGTTGNPNPLVKLSPTVITTFFNDSSFNQ
jgi:sugar lactone lactonase YvrE